MSAVKFYVPEGWHMGEELRMTRMGTYYILARCYHPFPTLSGDINPDITLQYKSQFEALMFLSWWFQ
jgi:hypothetical protein